MLSKSKSFIFIHIPKSAGNSIQEKLLRYTDEKITKIDHQDGVERFGITGPVTKRKHFSVAEYEAAIGQAQLSSMFIFCVIRNPWQRAVSHYFSPHRWINNSSAGLAPRKSRWIELHFLAMLKTIKPASYYLKNIKGVIQVNQVIQYDNLADDFTLMCRKLGLAEMSLNHRNRSTKMNDWTEYYTNQHVIDSVRDHFAEDLSIWPFKPPKINQNNI